MSGPGATVIFVGVAGQPVLATARILGEAARAAGLVASVSEALPPAQAAGSVAVHVRMGAVAVASPCAGEGQADALVALEAIEALRAAPLLAPGAFAAVNERGARTWRLRALLEGVPRDVVGQLQGMGIRAVGVRAEALTRRPAGDLLVGIALLGVVAPTLPIPAAALEGALGSPPPLAAGRRRVLERGRRLFASLPARLAAPAPAEGDRAEGRRR